MNWFRMRLIAIAFIVIALWGCSNTHRLTKHQLYVFGTLVEISVWHKDDKETKHAINLISNKFNQMHYHWHAWKPGRLNEINLALRNAETVELNVDEASFIKRTIQLSNQSDHLFNPTIGELIHLWGFHTDEYPILTAPPSQEDIDALVEQSITVNSLNLTGKHLSSSNQNVWLDFGGIAKGYAIDTAIELLQKSGIQHAIINAGGDLRSIGKKDTIPWRVAIQSPKDWSMLAEIAVNQDEAIFTSGNYQRYKEFKGKRYAHIIDPRTGMPVKQIVSATVISGNGILADAAATAIVVAGNAWPSVAQKLNIKQALVIDDQHRCFTTSKMLSRLENKSIECQIVD